MNFFNMRSLHSHRYIKRGMDEFSVFICFDDRILYSYNARIFHLVQEARDKLGI